MSFFDITEELGKISSINFCSLQFLVIVCDCSASSECLWNYAMFLAVSLGCVVLSCFSHVWPCATPWAIACQAALSMGFSRQEYWSGLPFPPPGDLPNPGIELVSLTTPALAGGFFTARTTWQALISLGWALQKHQCRCLPTGILSQVISPVLAVA